MTIVLYGLATLAVIFGRGILDLLFGRVLPKEYRSDATQRVVQTATGLISLRSDCWLRPQRISLMLITSRSNNLPLGSGLIDQSQKATAAAIQIADK